MPDSTTSDHDVLEQKRDPPGQVGGDEAAEQRADRGGDRGRRADQRVGLLLRGALEVAVDQGLHRGQQQRRAEAADDGPEDDDRGQALGERHRQRADRVAEQAQHVGPLAPDQVADLAPDQDERGGHERLERDRRLHAADGRVQVVHHRRDRDVHHRRVDDEHEHRHRQQDRQPLRAAGLPRPGGRCHWLSGAGSGPLVHDEPMALSARASRIGSISPPATRGGSSQSGDGRGQLKAAVVLSARPSCPHLASPPT